MATDKRFLRSPKVDSNRLQLWFVLPTEYHISKCGWTDMEKKNILELTGFYPIFYGYYIETYPHGIPMESPWPRSGFCGVLWWKLYWRRVESFFFGGGAKSEMWIMRLTGWWWLEPWNFEWLSHHIGNNLNWLTHIFQRGWNHQPVNVFWLVVLYTTWSLEWCLCFQGNHDWYAGEMMAKVVSMSSSWTFPTVWSITV